MDNVANNRDYIHGLYLWLFLAESISWGGNDFMTAVAEAKKLGRGVTPEEIDLALAQLAYHIGVYRTE